MKNSSILTLILCSIVGGNASNSSFIDHDNHYHPIKNGCHSYSYKTQSSDDVEQMNSFKTQLAEQFEARVKHSLHNGESLSWLFNQGNDNFMHSKEQTRKAITDINNKFINKSRSGAFDKINMDAIGCNFFVFLSNFQELKKKRDDKISLLENFMESMGAFNLTQYQNRNQHRQQIFFEPDSQLVLRFKTDENSIIISAYTEEAKQVIISEMNQERIDGHRISTLLDGKTYNEYAKISFLEYFNPKAFKYTMAVNPAPHVPTKEFMAQPNDALDSLSFTHDGRTLNWNQLSASAKFHLSGYFKALVMNISHNNNVKQFFEEPKIPAIEPFQAPKAPTGTGYIFEETESHKRKRFIETLQEDKQKKKKIKLDNETITKAKTFLSKDEDQKKSALNDSIFQSILRYAEYGDKSAIEYLQQLKSNPDSKFDDIHDSISQSYLETLQWFAMMGSEKAKDYLETTLI